MLQYQPYASIPSILRCSPRHLVVVTTLILLTRPCISGHGTHTATLHSPPLRIHTLSPALLVAPHQLHLLRTHHHQSNPLPRQDNHAPNLIGSSFSAGFQNLVEQHASSPVNTWFSFWGPTLPSLLLFFKRYNPTQTLAFVCPPFLWTFSFPVILLLQLIPLVISPPFFLCSPCFPSSLKETNLISKSK
jgi:hypothetical protein